MHDDIEGIDCEMEKLIQYLDHNTHYEEHFDIEEEKETLPEEELKKLKFSNSVVKRIRRLRQLRKEKDCLKFGSNVSLRCVDSQGIVQTVLAYCRYTPKQVGIIITNFEDTDRSIWVDFSSLNNYISFKRSGIERDETTIIKIQSWDQKITDEYHLINEFLNFPFKFEIKSNDSLVFEVHILGDINSHPEHYTEARNNFITTLATIHNGKHYFL